MGTISGVGMVSAGSDDHLADGLYWTVDPHLSVQVGNRYCVSDLWIHSWRIVPAARPSQPRLVMQSSSVFGIGCIVHRYRGALIFCPKRASLSDTY